MPKKPIHTPAELIRMLPLIRARRKASDDARLARMQAVWQLLAEQCRDAGIEPPAFPVNPSGTANRVQRLAAAHPGLFRMPNAIVANDLGLDTEATPFVPRVPKASEAPPRLCRQRPGTAARIAYYTVRVEQGVEIWQPGDCSDSDLDQRIEDLAGQFAAAANTGRRRGAERRAV